MAFGSSCASQKDQIFNLINFMGRLSFFFTLNLAFVHHPLITILIEQNIDLDLFYDTHMLKQNK